MFVSELESMTKWNIVIYFRYRIYKSKKKREELFAIILYVKRDLIQYHTMLSVIRSFSFISITQQEKEEHTYPTDLHLNSPEQISNYLMHKFVCLELSKPWWSLGSHFSYSYCILTAVNSIFIAFCGVVVYYIYCMLQGRCIIIKNRNRSIWHLDFIDIGEFY